MSSTSVPSLCPVLPLALAGLAASPPGSAVQEPRTVRVELPNGAVLEHGLIADSAGVEVPHGPWVVRDAEGQSRLEGELEHGLRTGTWRFRRPNGDKLADGTYRKGRREGKWTFTLPTGERDEVRSGRYEWSASGDTPAGPREEGPLLNGARQGRWTFRWPDGSLLLAGSFHRGRLQPGFEFRHADGSLDPGFLDALGVGEVVPPEAALCAS